MHVRPGHFFILAQLLRRSKKMCPLLVVRLLRNPFVPGPRMAGLTQVAAGTVLARGKVRTVEGAGLGLWLGYLETLYLMRTCRPQLQPAWALIAPARWSV